MTEPSGPRPRTVGSAAAIELKLVAPMSSMAAAAPRSVVHVPDMPQSFLLADRMVRREARALHHESASLLERPVSRLLPGSGTRLHNILISCRD